MPSFGKRNPLTSVHFDDFVKVYTAEDRTKVEDERFNVFTREEIRKKDDNLDIGLVADESLSVYDNLPDPIDSAENAIAKLEEAIALLNEVVTELKSIETTNVDYKQDSSEKFNVAEGNEVYRNE